MYILYCATDYQYVLKVNMRGISLPILALI